MAADGDLVVVMGAGPVWKIGHAFLGRGAGNAR
jgi:UDP-N-acetylmuramate-alanine ligase